MKKYHIAVIGGDRRLTFLCKLLEERGIHPVSYGVLPLEDKPGGQADTLWEAVKAADAVVCGIPFARGEFLSGGVPGTCLTTEALYRCLNERRKQRPDISLKLMGGNIPGEFRERCTEAGIGCFDFMEEGAFTLYNTIATAEGVLLEALKNSETNIHRSASLVIGYGRCGRVLTDKLKGLSARVTVASRNAEELAQAESYGMDILPMHALKEEILRFEYIYNTVPAVILEEETLQRTKKDVLILDIASGAGGVDYEAAYRLKRKALLCQGLPGKYAARASADRMAEYVLREISAREGSSRLL